jgi:hypothetical protein
MVVTSIRLLGQEPAAEKQVSSSQVPAPEFIEFSASKYTDLEILWKSATEANSNDANAWLNYYKAARFSNRSPHSDDISKEEKKKLDKIMADMKVAIPSSFEFHYASYLHGDKSDASFSSLLTAYQLNPENSELYDDLLCRAIIYDSKNDIKQFAEKLSATGVYNATEVEYNRNVFGSVENNAILITNGNVDTYPLLLMQLKQSYRADVTVICLDWLNSETYRATVAKLLSTSAVGLNFDKILKAAKTKPVYVALTVPPAPLKKYGGELYCTGLALKHSYVPLKNLETLAYNWENHFAFSKFSSQDLINKNYLIPLIQLRDHYQKRGRTNEYEKVDLQVRELSDRFGLASSIKKHLD